MSRQPAQQPGIRPATPFLLTLTLLLAHAASLCSAFTAADMQQLTDHLSSNADALSREQVVALHRNARMRWSSSKLDACPAWISDYADSHKAALRKPASARFMMHRCWDNNTRGCPGVGDRIRGLMETFAWAAYTGRTFLLKWEDAAPLEALLVPSRIDWRVRPTYGLDKVPEDEQVQYWWANRELPPDDILTDAFSRNSSLTRLKMMTLTHPYQGCTPQLRSDPPRGGFRFQRKPLPGPDIGCVSDLPPDLRSCIFHALFKPSPRLLDFVAQARTQLLGGAGAPYVAVHLRLGGFEGERSDIRRFGSNVDVATLIARVLSAAKALAKFRGISAPVLVLTDNDLLREALQAGRLPGFVSPTYKAAHVQGVQHTPGASLEDAQLTSFADIALLAGATCFIGSKSGFTSTSLIWGRHKCYVTAQDLPRCIATAVQAHSCMYPLLKNGTKRSFAGEQGGSRRPIPDTA